MNDKQYIRYLKRKIRRLQKRYNTLDFYADIMSQQLQEYRDDLEKEKEFRMTLTKLIETPYDYEIIEKEFEIF